MQKPNTLDAYAILMTAWQSVQADKPACNADGSTPVWPHPQQHALDILADAAHYVFVGQMGGAR